VALYNAFVHAVHVVIAGGTANPAPGTTPSWLEAFGIVAAAVASLGVLITAAVKSAKLVRGIGHFLDDWNGEEARSGFEARPGVLARLAAVEKFTVQLTPNGGAHIADAVARMEAKLNTRSDMPAVLERIGGRLDRIEQHLVLPVDEHAKN
jgi:hypothetical protein